MMTATEIEFLVTRAGLTLEVRPARPEDEPALADFFARVTPDDLRFRFLTGVRHVTHDRLVEMIRGDERTLSLIAFDELGDVVATAMLAGDAQGSRSEAAIALRGDKKGQGVGWTLLEHLVGHARNRGYAAIESIEDRFNRSAINLEREMGFETLPVEGDPTLVCVRKTLGR